MRRDDMLRQRIKEVRDSGLYDDPDVIAYDPAPSWVHTAVLEGWAKQEEISSGFLQWRLTEEGKAQAKLLRPVGRPPLTLAEQQERDAQRRKQAGDWKAAKAIDMLRAGRAVYGDEWLQQIIKAVQP